LTATAGALLATAFLSAAVAHADPNTFVVIPDPEDGPSAITAVGGIAPFDTTISYSGFFASALAEVQDSKEFLETRPITATSSGCTTSNFRVSSAAR
jgi:hypothetical protein